MCVPGPALATRSDNDATSCHSRAAGRKHRVGCASFPNRPLNPLTLLAPHKGAISSIPSCLPWVSLRWSWIRSHFIASLASARKSAQTRQIICIDRSKVPEHLILGSCGVIHATGMPAELQIYQTTPPKCRQSIKSQIMQWAPATTR